MLRCGGAVYIEENANNKSEQDKNSIYIHYIIPPFKNIDFY